MQKFIQTATLAASLPPAERLDRFKTTCPLCAAAAASGIPLWVSVRRAEALQRELAAGPIHSLAIAVKGDEEQDPDGFYFLGFRDESPDDLLNRWNPLVAALGYPDPTI